MTSMMIWFLNHFYMAVVPDDDIGRISEKEEQQAGNASHVHPMPPGRLRDHQVTGGTEAGPAGAARAPREA
jgi:hypothetical protein